MAIIGQSTSANIIIGPLLNISASTMVTLEIDNDARAELYKQADAIIIDEFISHIPLHYYDRSIMVKNGLHFEYPPFGAPHFDTWYFE